MQSPNVDYFELPELPGKPMFTCQRRAATLQPGACAAMWRTANDNLSPNRTLACRGCQIGADHADVPNSSSSQIRGVAMCVRCHRVGLRLVAGHTLCVSCWNREREYLVGRNARGKPPVTHPVLHRTQAWGVVSGVVQGWALARATSVLEALVMALRDSQQQVMFGFKRDMNVEAQA